MDLASLVRRDLIFSDLPGSDRETVLRAFAERIAALGLVPDAEDLYRRLRDREELGSTGIGSQVAIPHCKLPGLRKILVAVGLSRAGVEFEACDDQPVRLFFTLVSPEDDPANHLHSLASISKWVKADSHVERILATEDPESIYLLLQEEVAAG